MARQKYANKVGMIAQKLSSTYGTVTDSSWSTWFVVAIILHGTTHTMEILNWSELQTGHTVSAVVIKKVLSQYHGKSPQELDHTSRAYTGQRTISIALFLSVLYLTSNGPITVATMQLKAKDIATKRFFTQV